MPARPVRVLLAEGVPAVEIGSTKPFKVVDARGKVRRLKPGTQNLVAAKIAQLRLPLRYVPGAAPLQLDGSAYRGALIVHRQAGKLTIVNRLPLDRYLRGVVPWEMPDDWHREALRAQAVVARSYALATLKPGTLFDLYADTRSQVYGGIHAEAASTNRAIGSTAGRVVYWNGTRCDDLLPLDLGRTDRLDRRGLARRNSRAVSRLRPRSLRRSLEAPPLGTVPAGRRPESGGSSASAPCATSSSRGEPSGRATEVTIKGRNGARTMLAQDFRRALDLRSTWFAVRVLNLEQPRGRALAVAGRPVVLKGLRPRARQGAARAAGERRHVDDRPAGAHSAGRALHGHGRSQAERRATASRRRSAPAGPSPSTLTDALLTWTYTTFTAFRLPSSS